MSRKIVNRNNRHGLLTASALALSIGLAGFAIAQDIALENIVIDGNIRIEEATILAYAGITPGGTITAGQANDALRRLQDTGLFETVDLRVDGGTIFIELQEYPTINQISIEGNDLLDDEALAALLTSQPRRVYSPAIAEADAQAIVDAYRQTGRLSATVTPQIIRRSDNRVDVAFEITEGRVVETESITFVGNRAFSDRRLRRVLQSTQAGFFRAIISRDTFVADRLAFDQQLLTDFYRDRGYVDFEVQSVTSELARARDGFFVTFNIVEGQSFSFGTVTATSDLPEVDVAEFQDAIDLRDGVTFSPRLVDRTITRLENLATEKSLRFIRVEPRITRNDEDLTLDVEFAIVRGPRVFVERIDIEGNATTLDRVVRRQFDLVEGDPFDPREIRQAAERIRALQFFENVDVNSRTGTSNDQVIVDVDLEEAPTGTLGFSVNYSSDVGTGLAVQFNERNWRGRGQTVGLSFDTTSGSRSLAFNFIEPAYLRRDLELSLSVFSNSTDQQNASYNTSEIGVSGALEFPISEYGRLRPSVRIAQEELTNVPAASSEILKREAGSFDASAIGLGYIFDTRGVGLDPTSGVLLRANAELGGLGEDQYVRTTALVQGETTALREEVSLRAAFEIGSLNMLDGNSRVTDRFFLGSRQMRGFDAGGIGPRDLNAGNRDALGGNQFAVARFEAGFPLGLPAEYGLSGGIFYDIGTLWGLDDVVGTGGNLVDDESYVRSTVGFSIFWETQIGPLRFNFSRPVANESYDRTRSFDLAVEARF
ncbi:outer membrane protein assembly factor BamA [Rhodobacteraceae bacterium XHP0102]|nr:outer membrane protein assembly factor BamA [Rhodobacteraceae bacterium XHP0102]